MGKSFKRRWSKTRIERLRELRSPTDDALDAGTAAVETVKEIIQTLSEPEPPPEHHPEPVSVVEEPTVATTTKAPKRRRRRSTKTTTVTE